MNAYIGEIKCFFDKYNICDKQLASFNDLIIKQVHEIINGIIKDEYDDDVLSNIAGLYYDQKIEDYVNAEKYYLMSIKQCNCRAMTNLASLYEMLKREIEAEKYYLMAIEHDHVNAMNRLGILYMEMKRYDEAEKYYLMANDHDNVHAAHNLAVMYYNIDRISDAEKYFMMTIEKYCDNTAMYILANIYYIQNKNDDAKKYYLMGVVNGNKHSLDKLKNLVNNDIELYNMINNIKDKNDHIYDILKELMKNKIVRNYKNKMNMSYKIGECPICYDNDIKLIALECAHYYCCSCYIQVLDKCAYNCDN